MDSNRFAATTPDSDTATFPLLPNEGESAAYTQSQSSDTAFGRQREPSSNHDGNQELPNFSITTPAADSGCAGSCRQIAALMVSPLVDEQGNALSILMGLISIFVGGSILGVGLFVLEGNNNPSSQFPSESYAILSSCLGYTYFLAWSVSFYPQVLTNFRRRTTAGLSVEFCTLNVLGFTCYSIFNVALYSSSTVQDLYRQRYGPDAPIPVHSNDVAFALHALLLSTISLLQVLYYDGIVRVRQMAPWSLLLMGAIMVVCILGVLLAAGIFHGPLLTWLDYIYLLSMCKILVSCVKYMPQVVLNWKRRSTTGWSIWQILLDLTGGFLSILQLVLDCFALMDFSGLTGNIPKLILGQVSILFDVVFCVQHYVLYPSTSGSESAALIPTENTDLFHAVDNGNSASEEASSSLGL